MGFISDKIESNKYNSDITQAVLNQNKVRYYIESDSPYKEIFNNRVLNIYNRDKYKFDRFVKAFKGDELPTSEIVKTIFTELGRVWESQNKHINREFTNDSMKEDAISFVKKHNKFIRQTLWEALKTQFNSFVVIDLPQEQTTLRPEPYPFILDISSVKYIKLDEGIKEIIFERIETVEGEDKKYFHYYTNEFYSVYLQDGKDEVEILPPSYHNIGHCPVRFIENRDKQTGNKILKDGSLLSVCEKMFWYVFKTIESRKADLLYLNPDKQAPKINCGYETKNEKCYGGKLADKNKQPLLSEDGKSHRLCPRCGEQQFNSGGAGNLIAIDYDSQAITSGKVDPSRDLVKYITPDIEGIKEQYIRIEQLGEDIIKSLVGVESVQTTEAINETQQIASFESKETVLKGLSQNLSETITWIEGTLLKLYAGNSFKSNTYDLGNVWYLYTVPDLLETRKNTVNPITKAELDEQIIDIKYINNKNKQIREKLLYKLLPYSTMTDGEFMSLIDKGRVSPQDEVLRLEFINLINMFEADYGDLVSYWMNFSEDVGTLRRLQIIEGILLNYENDKINNLKQKENVQD